MNRADIVATTLATLALQAPALLATQVCAGSPSLTEVRLRASAGIASYAYATALGVSFTTGKTFYGTLGGGTTYDREQDARTYDFTITGGADIPHGSSSIYFCPVAVLSVSMGPYDYLLSQTDYRYVDAALGAGVAMPIHFSGFSVTPGIGVRVARITVSQIPSDAERQAGVPAWTQNDTYFHFTAGCGVTFNQTLTIKPEFTLVTGLIPTGEPNAFAAPFGRDENDLSIGVTVAISFGQRSR